MTETSHNPWLGLLSYQDPDKTDINHRFCGRETAISSLFAMVDNNLLVTVYGKTGIGKTSVLNAGVFPLLRSRNYLPVSVRLGKYDSDAHVSFAQRIVAEIEAEVKRTGGSVVANTPDSIRGNSLAVDYLWRYFLTTSFSNKAGNCIFPVVALDQFEEIFINSPQEAAQLLKQIYALIDDNREVPQAEGYSDVTNFRFVFSIREDDLFYLEDIIDTCHLTAMKQNRYRLCPLTEDEAREVVMLGRDLMDEGEEEEVTVRVINLAKDENGHISTNLLSLVCSRLFIQFDGHLTAAALNTFSENPLESFYSDCVSHISETAREFIETRMVEQDRRRFVSKKELNEALTSEDVELLSEGEHKILQNVTAGSTECVELIHDSLAKTICRMRTEAAERRLAQRALRNSRIIRRTLYVAVLLVFCAIGINVWQCSNNERLQAINAERRHTFAINFEEDSLVTDKDYWEARLTIYPVGMSSTDTLISQVVTKADKSTTIDFEIDSVEAIHVRLDYGDRYDCVNIDTTLYVSDLTRHPSIKLVIRKENHDTLTYSGSVRLKIDNMLIPLQNAIVILHDRVQRTDSVGRFTFKTAIPIDSTDVLLVVQGTDCYRFALEGHWDGDRDFEATPADSLSKFRAQCEYMDTLSGWLYSTLSNNRWAEVRMANEQKDRIVLKARPHGGKDRHYRIEGFYYYEKEYARLPVSEKYRSYHLFSGWMSSVKMKGNPSVKSKPYELESYDIAGNRQRICGAYYRDGHLDGEITSMGQTVGWF